MIVCNYLQNRVKTLYHPIKHEEVVNLCNKIILCVACIETQACFFIKYDVVQWWA